MKKFIDGENVNPEVLLPLFSKVVGNRRNFSTVKNFIMGEKIRSYKNALKSGPRDKVETPRQSRGVLKPGNKGYVPPGFGIAKNQAKKEMETVVKGMSTQTDGRRAIQTGGKEARSSLTTVGPAGGLRGRQPRPRA